MAGNIVSTDYHYKPPPKRKKLIAIPNRIVTAKAPKPKPSVPVTGKAVTRKQAPAAVTEPRIVTPTKRSPPRHVPTVSTEGPATTDVTSAAPPPAERKSAIVTASNPRAGRFGRVPEMDAEEYQRRGDAAEAFFRELVSRAAWNAGS